MANQRVRTMDEPVIHNDGESTFFLVDGVKIAKRGRRDTANARAMRESG
jgi:hypothetical protein